MAKTKKIISKEIWEMIEKLDLNDVDGSIDIIARAEKNKLFTSDMGQTIRMGFTSRKALDEFTKKYAALAI